MQFISLSALKHLKSFAAKYHRNSIWNARNIIQHGAVPMNLSSAATKHKNGLHISVDQTYHQFTCRNFKYYPEFNMTAYLLEHETLKTQYIHIDRNDNNNVFSVNFRTPTLNSSGLPHILEHLVLCGSEKFPVRDPFFKMLNRSLATFMNAMTGPDYTLYPFSSTNEKDFRNLQMVYLDAVFKPNLRHIDFLQEGWRLENSDLNNVDSDICLKGVVFNEMKGAFATNNMILNYGIMNNLLPDHTYGHVSGGWPLAIPNLNWEDLVKFHKKHYHPSNARIFSYGNFDLLKTLQFINAEYMSQFKRIDSLFSKVPAQKRWKQAIETSITCRFDSIGAPIEKQCQIGIGYVMTNIANPYETLLLNVISELLVKGPNSAFYKSLIEPNIIGGSFGQTTGFDAQVKDTTFVVALQNINSKDFDLIQRLFEDTIDHVIANGFDEDHIQSILNNIELQIKHQTKQFGLHLLFSITPSWNHDSDMLEALNLAKHFNELKENLKDKTYLQRKVDEYFKQNKHKMTLKMLPDENYEKNMQEAEQQLLEEKISALTIDDKRKILEISNELAKEQKEPSTNIHLLPCLSIDDISKNIEELNIQHTSFNNIPTQLTLLDTNDIIYMQGICYSDHLTESEKLLIPLLAQVFAKMGTKNLSYGEFDKLVNLKSSGISFHTHFAENITDVNLYELGIRFELYGLEQNADNMFNIIKELLLNFELLDIQRFSVLLEEYVSAITADIAQAGHLYSIQSSSGLITEGSQLKAKLSGIEHIVLMKKMCGQKSPEEILLELQNTAKHLFGKCAMKFAINMHEKSRAKILKSFNTFTNEISSCIDVDSSKSPKWIQGKQLVGLKGSTSCLHNVVNIPVNYCSKSMLMVPYANKGHPLLRVLAKLLSSKYLLPIVREQNGAYGAGARLDMDGIFSFYSYRDPNNRKTLDTFDQAMIWLNDNWSSIDDQAIFEAKLGVLQAIDAPVAPGYKGLTEFKYGITPKIFNSQRNRVIAANKEKIFKCAEKYFSLKECEFNTVGKSLLGPAANNLNSNDEIWCVNDFSKVD